MDFTSAPSSPERLREILDRVVSVGDLAETGALEAKSGIDLNSNVGRAKVAKFILGKCNRRPEDAVRHFAGHGVMVLGAAQGSGPGLPASSACEDHQLADALRVYLGAASSRWRMERLPAATGDQHVHFVIVEPPAPGDDVFPCCRSLDFDAGEKKFSLTDGAIYVRDRTSTRVARHSEVIGLVERARAFVAPEIQLEVGLAGAAVVLRDSESTLDWWIDVGSAGFLEDRAEAREGRLPGTPSLLGPYAGSAAEAVAIALGQPTDHEVLAGWQHETRSRWRERVDLMVGAMADAVVPTVLNQAMNFLPNPQLVLRIAGARGVESGAIVYADDVLVPVVPATRSVFEPLHLPVPRRTDGSARWSNSDDGTVEIVLAPGSFRPETPWSTEELGLVVVALDENATSLPVEWSLTVEGVDGRFTGSTSMAVDPDLTVRMMAEGLLPPP